jgi:ATP-binding cassette subfamily B protein
MKYYCVRQHDQKDCGAACLATIARDYGHKAPLAYYRNLTKTDSNGINIFGLVDAMQQLEFEAEAYEVTMNDLLHNEEITFPLIARIISEQNMNHFVVINNIKHGKLLISDPAKGKTTYSFSDFQQVFTGYIVTCMPSENFVPKVEESKTILFLRQLMKDNHTCILLACILSLIITGCGILFSYGIQYEFETLENQEILISQYGEINLETLEQEHENGETSEEEYISLYYLAENVLWLRENLYQLILLLGTVVIIQLLLGYIRQRITVRIAAHVSRKTLTKVTETILHMPQSHLDNWKSGDLIMRYTDAETISNGLISVTFTLIVDTIMAIVGALILYHESAVLFGIICIMVAMYILIMVAFVKPIKNVNLKELEAVTNQNSLIKESVDSIYDIKGYGIEEYARQRVEEKINHSIKWYKNARKTEITQSCLISWTSNVCNIVLLVAAFILISNGKLSIGTYIAFMSLMDFFISPVENLVNLQGVIQNAAISAERLSDVLDEQNEFEKNTTLIPFVCNKEISVSNITFRYGNAMPILENFSCCFPIGKYTLIIGENGTGKSTVVKLLLGRYVFEQGEIQFDGVDINKISIDSLKHEIIYISQNPNILSCSIIENISFGLQSIDKVDVIKMCNMVGIAEYIDKLPNKYNSMLEEQGRNLSTGQRQRLSLARALLRKPQILILDEATSNIDKKSEREIYKNIKNEFPHMTVISIMHDINSEIVFDNIIKMELLH